MEYLAKEGTIWRDWFINYKEEIDPEKDRFISYFVGSNADRWSTSPFGNSLTFCYSSQENVSLRAPDGGGVDCTDEIIAGAYESYSW